MRDEVQKGLSFPNGSPDMDENTLKYPFKSKVLEYRAKTTTTTTTTNNEFGAKTTNN